MKRYIKSASDNQIAQAKKYVRTLIYTVWTTDEFGNHVKYFSDPDMMCNVLKEAYKASETNMSFSEWIYAQRDELFKDFVYEKLDESRYSDEVVDIAKEYFDNLTPADYNRNLYLKRESQ